MSELKVLFASSEAVPFAMTGGMADVSGTLPIELNKLGHDVRLIMPKYKCIPQKYIDKMEYVGYVYVDIGWRHQYCAVMKLKHENMTVYFIDNEYYFDREGLYGHVDEAEQFTFFSKAILDVLPLLDFKPDIIHCNDWQTGLVSMYLKTKYKQHKYYQNIKTIFTIHNLKYQGIFSKEVLPDLIGLGWEHYKINGIEFYGCVNYMKAGLVYSDIISTVSETYAQEIKYDFFGEKLNGIINQRQDSLYGILNGIDNEKNNPATDKRLFTNYDIDNLDGKYENKRHLQKSLGLPRRKDVPLIGIVSRLVDQKGFDLISCIIEELLQLDIQFVLLGSGEKKYEDMFRWAVAKYPYKMSANIGFNSTLAQRIYAACDMFLMPSLFEPCGLSQLYSLRHGTVPIVREIGGLNDTVVSYNEKTGEGNGFTFTNYNAHEMLFCIKRAIQYFYKKDDWEKIINNGMAQNFSWESSAKEYIKVYDKLITK